MKIKISIYAYYGKYEGGSLDDYVIVEDTREGRLGFLLDTTYTNEEEELEDFEWEDNVTDFLDGKIDEITYRNEGDWDDPTAYTFKITTYEDELKELENKIEKLKKEFGVE